MSTEKRPAGSLQRLLWALTSWRTASVSLLSFSAGLPLGLLWYAVPDWMRSAGIDIRQVGFFTLVQAPWTFKMLWSPLMDRFVPAWLGRRRGWIALAQIALCILTFSLAALGRQPEPVWLLAAIGVAIAFAGASQDIVLDAYAVDVLRRDEQGLAVGARTATYRIAMALAGGLSISLAGLVGWSAVNVFLALLYLPMLVVTVRAPEPEARISPPRSLTDAVWRPFLGFLARHRALEMLAFVLFYKLADNLAQSLQRPFLVDMGYNETDRGLALTTVGVLGALIGTFVGGALTTAMGLGHSLWVFGFLQVFSNLGFIFVAESAVNRPLMYGAMGFESLTSGLGTGAFAVLLLRMTQKRFSATQYALFSSLFGLPRLLAGPITGVTVHALGWSPFFWLTLLAGIPGLVLLARFVPPGLREPEFIVEPPSRRPALSRSAIAARGVGIGILCALGGLVILAALDAAEPSGDAAGASADAGQQIRALLLSGDLSRWPELLGAVVFGGACGLLAAATLSVRRGAGARSAAEEEDEP